MADSQLSERDKLIRDLEKFAKGSGAPSSQPSSRDVLIADLEAFASGETPTTATNNGFPTGVTTGFTPPVAAARHPYDIGPSTATVADTVTESAFSAYSSGQPYDARQDRSDLLRQARLPGAIAALPPERQQSFIDIQNAPGQTPRETAGLRPDALVMGDFLASEFLAQFTPLATAAPAKVGLGLAEFSGVELPDSVRGFLERGASLPQEAEEVNAANPPLSQGEAIARGAAGAAGFGMSMMTPPAMIGAGLGSKIGGPIVGRALGVPETSGVAHFAPGLIGFTAAEQIPAAIAGEVSPGEAAINTLGSPVSFLNLPQHAAEATGAAIADPDAQKTRDAILTAAPALLLALAREKRAREGKEVAPVRDTGPIRMGQRRLPADVAERVARDTGAGPTDVVREGAPVDLPKPKESPVESKAQAALAKLDAKEGRQPVLRPGAEFSNKSGGGKSVSDIPDVVFRVGAEGESASKPQGLYTSPSKDHPAMADAAIDGGKPSTLSVNKNAKILTVSGADTFKTNRGVVGESAGIAALRKFVGDKEASRIASLKKSDAIAEAKKTDPSVNWERYFDAHEIAEARAAKIARDKGYDAIWAPDQQNPKFSEFVALSDSAFSKLPAPDPAIPPKGPRSQPLEPSSRGGGGLTPTLPPTGKGGKPPPPDTRDPGSGPVSPMRERPKRPIIGGALSTPGVSFYAQSLLDRVGTQGGPTGRVVRERGLQAVRKAGEIDGKVAQKLFEFEQVGRNVPGGKFLIREKRQLPKEVRDDLPKARKSLEQDAMSLPVEGGGEMGFSRMQMAVEGTLNPEFGREKQIFSHRPLSAAEKEYVQRYGDITKTLFKEARKRGVKAIKDGRAVDFMSEAKGNKFIRVPTAQFYQILPNSEAFRGLRNGLSKINNMTVKETQEALKEMQDPMAIRTVGSIEALRVFKHFPTHFKTKDGKVIQLLETDPLRAARGGIRHIADRTAFIEVFGQETKGLPIGEKGKDINKLRARFIENGGFEKDFNALVAALNDRPSGPQITSHSPKGDSIKSIPRRIALGFVSPAVETAMLSMAAIPNLFETARLGSLAGTGRSVRAFGELAERGLGRVFKGGPGRAELRELGAITTSLIDFHLQKGRRIEDLGRIIGTIGRRITGFDPINEFNESFAAETGRVMALDLSRGFTQRGDAARLRSMEFTPEEVKSMINQTAPQSLYNDISRRMGKTQGSTLRLAEQSPFQNSTLWKRVLPFQSYMQLSARLMNRIVNDFATGIRDRDAKQVAGAASTFTKFIAANTLAGAASIWFLSLVGGKDRDRGDESWPEWIGKNMSATLMGGPLQSLKYGIERDSDITEIVGGMSAPTRVLQEAINASSGRGAKYRDLDGPERILKFFESSVPVSRVQKGYLVLAGMHDEKMDSATTSYWEWRRENKPSPSVEARDSSVFRKHMKDAYRKLRNGDLDGADSEVALAIMTGEKDKPVESIRDSLNARKLLFGLDDEELGKLRKAIGDKKFEKLKTHDALIAEFQWKNPKAARIDWWRGRLGKLDKDTMTREQHRRSAKIDTFYRSMNEIKRAMDMPDKSREWRREKKARLDKLIERAYEETLKWE